MLKLLEFRGFLRNHREMARLLGLPEDLPRREREEAIVREGCRRFGEKLPEMLQGTFAFALEESESGEIFCARDPFGAKAFYYTVTADGRFLGSHSIRKLLEDPQVQCILNEDMLGLYLTYTYVPGTETFFKGIHKLAPGHTLRFAGGQVTLRRYFAPRFAPDESKTLEEWGEEIHRVIAETFPECEEDGERIESFLSGGVDSSYVFALSHAKRSASIGYRDARFDEQPLAAATARLLGRENLRLEIEPEEYFAAVPYVMENMEQPLADASAIVFALGCRAAAQRTDICFSGEGADEFFGGYHSYSRAGHFRDPLEKFYIGNTNILKEDEKALLLKNYIGRVRPIDVARPLHEEILDLDERARMQLIDIQLYLDGDIQLNVDKMSEAAGLEVRMPLLDRRIFDVASRIPGRFMVSEEQTKIAFRKAAAHVLPAEIAERRKLGFPVPIRTWMADPRYNGDVEKRLHSEAAGKFFHLPALHALWQRYLEGDDVQWRKLWTVYTFLVWYGIYFEDLKVN